MPTGDSLSAHAQKFVDILLENSHVVDPNPDSANAHSDGLPVFRNYDWIDAGGATKRAGLSVHDVRADLNEITNGWPKCAGGMLFCEDANGRPRYLNTPNKLFAWIDDLAMIEWSRGVDAVTQERFFENLRNNAEQYDTVEIVPHWPPRPNTFYMHPVPPAFDGQFLQTLINFFLPLTDVDRQLIRAFILTLFWGGEPGSRPIWLFTGPDNDPQQGRGVGKSKLVELISELVGGMIEFSKNADIEGIKTRLLSPDAAPYRVARLDNIKTRRFSWAELEGLITSSVISGHRMYHGDGRRPNLLTWVITLNGASLSMDMAQRCVIVKLARPTHSGSWEHEVRSFIANHRWEIIADVRKVLGAL